MIDDDTAANLLACTARLDIRRASKMTEEGKVEVADWLREQAEKLLSDGHQYSVIYTAKYNPDPEEDEAA